MKKPLIILSLCLCGSLLRAQQTDTAGIYREREDTLASAVFTAARAANYLSKGKELRTEVISSQGLMKMACCNLAESFENSASVTVGYSDAVTGARQIRLLGLSGVYTQMLDENRPVMRGLSAPFGLSYVPGPWLESIQIAKGSPSVINGVESMTGQINLEHKKPTDEKPLFLNASVMSDTKADLNVVSAFQLSPTVYTNILGHVDGNFKTEDMNMDGFADDPRMLQFDLASRWLYYTPEWVIHWGVSAVNDRRRGGQEGYRKGDYMSGGPWGTDIYNRSLSAYAKIGHALREDNSASIAFIADYTTDKMDAWFGPSLYDARQHAVFGNLMYRNHVSEAHDFTVGFSGSFDRYAENLDRILPRSARQYAKDTGLFHGGLYGEYTFHAGEVFSAIAGLRGEWYNEGGFRVSPRVTLKYQPADWLVLRANGGRGLRNALPLTDNFGVLSTGKVFDGELLAHPLEASWTFGGNATFYFPFWGSYLSLDYFGTRFSDKLIADYEDRPGVISFYTGRSRSDSWQADLHSEPFPRFTVDVTARYTGARTEYRTRGDSETPLLAPWKAVLNLQYRTRLDRWIFDFTASWNGSARVYDFMKDLRDADGALLYPDGRTPSYPLLYAQITRRFRGFDLYAGGENLTNFRQKDVILGSRMADGMIDPESADFDASAVWGPLMGIKFNIGIRLTLWRPTKL